MKECCEAWLEEAMATSGTLAHWDPLFLSPTFFLKVDGGVSSLCDFLGLSDTVDEPAPLQDRLTGFC